MTVISYDKRILRRGVLVSIVLVGVFASWVLVTRQMFSNWTDFVMVAIGVWFSLKLLAALRKFFWPPQVTIGDEGIRDAALNSVLIPWPAIHKIIANTWPKKYGESIFVQADPEQIPVSQLPLTLRVSTGLAHASSKESQQRLICPLTPAVALDATLDEVLDVIRPYCERHGIPIEYNDATAGKSEGDVPKPGA